MKLARTLIMVLLALVVAFMAGSFSARERARIGVLSGPLSDNYDPALEAIANARAKLRAGDTNILEQLQIAESHIKAAQKWSIHFLGQRETNSPAAIP